MSSSSSSVSPPPPSSSPATYLDSDTDSDSDTEIGCETQQDAAWTRQLYLERVKYMGPVTSTYIAKFIATYDFPLPHTRAVTKAIIETINNLKLLESRTNPRYNTRAATKTVIATVDHLKFLDHLKSLRS